MQICLTPGCGLTDAIAILGHAGVVGGVDHAAAVARCVGTRRCRDPGQRLEASREYGSVNDWENDWSRRPDLSKTLELST